MRRVMKGRKETWRNEEEMTTKEKRVMRGVKNIVMGR